jgi:Na+/glutamate symporter
MTRILVIKKKIKLDENVKKKDSPQNKTQTKEKQKTQNPSSFILFTFLVLLHVDVGVIIVIILLLCSRKWLLSYVPSCHENLENRFTTNPLNGIITRLPTRPFYTKMD